MTDSPLTDEELERIEQYGLRFGMRPTDVRRIVAEVRRLTAALAEAERQGGQHSRATAYALVERELRSVMHHNRMLSFGNYERVEMFLPAGDASTCSDHATLIEAVDKLRGERETGGGENG